MSPERIILETIRMDHRPHENARRIITELAAHGFRITDEPRATLPTITRTYAEPLGWTTSSAGGLW